nr:molybdopterin dinucleotide-binding protein [Eggerthellaceae bacterium]
IALAWAKIIYENGLMDDLYMKRWSNAPFIVVDDMEPSGGIMYDNTGACDMKTTLLKECDLVEGGSYQKFYVHDATKAKEGKTGMDALSFFDVEVTQWEGEHKTADDCYKNGRKVKVGTPWEGWLPDPSTFDSIDPDLVWEGEVTLKDGTVHKARTVWAYYVDMLADKTPEWAEEVTGVDAKKIRDACLAWATNLDPESGYGNGGIHISLAMDQNGNNYQTIRAIMLLSHMTGNLDGPAGNRGPTKARFRDGIWLPWYAFDYNPEQPYLKPDAINFYKNEMMAGGDDHPLMKWYNQWAEPYHLWKCVLESDPYPIVGGANDSGSFMNQNNSGIAWEAMNKLDFWMEVNLWHHPTADCADILLPPYHWLEMRFPRISQGPHCGLGMNVQCVEAPGDCKNDCVIMEELFKAMGIPWTMDPTNPYPTWDETLEHMFESSDMPYDSYKEFEADYQKNGWQNAKKCYPKEMGTYRRYETGYMHLTPGVGDGQVCFGLNVPGCDPGTRFGYLTPTSKYEVWPTVLESYAMGYGPIDRSWLVPDYREPKDSPISQPERHKEYPFLATTGRRIPVYFHSEHRQLPWCREQWPVPRIEINPLDAEELGIDQGDWVWIETEWGKIRECADLYHGIGRGVVNLEHAWWFPELSAPRHGEHLCNCNELLDPDNRDPVMGSSCMRGFQVKIYKATPENSPFGNPVPCDDDGTEIIHDSSDPRLKEWLPDYSLNGSDY